MNHSDHYEHAGKRRVTIDRDVYEQLTEQADAWRTLTAEIGEVDQLAAMLIEAPGVRELLMQEYAAWCARRASGETGTAISHQVEGRHWGPSHTELIRRRQQPGSTAEDYRRRHGGEHRGGPVAWSSPDQTGRGDAA